MNNVEQTVQPKPLKKLRTKSQVARELTLDVDDVTSSDEASTSEDGFIASPGLLEQNFGPTSDPQPNPKPFVSGPKLTPREKLSNKYDYPRPPKMPKSKQKKKRKLSDLPKRQLKHFLSGVSPQKFMTSSVNEVEISPWMSEEEFKSVYSWLYSNKPELMQKGIARVASWSMRCHLPVGISITVHLCEAFLMEMNHNAGSTYQALSFGYSVAITRSVRKMFMATMIISNEH